MTERFYGIVHSDKGLLRLHTDLVYEPKGTGQAVFYSLTGDERFPPWLVMVEQVAQSVIDKKVFNSYNVPVRLGYAPESPSYSFEPRKLQLVSVRAEITPLKEAHKDLPPEIQEAMKRGFEQDRKALSEDMEKIGGDLHRAVKHVVNDVFGGNNPEDGNSPTLVGAEIAGKVEEEDNLSLLDAVMVQECEVEHERLGNIRRDPEEMVDSNMECPEGCNTDGKQDAYRAGFHAGCGFREEIYFTSKIFGALVYIPWFFRGYLAGLDSSS